MKRRCVMVMSPVPVVLLMLVATSQCRFLSHHTSLTGQFKKCSNEGESVVVDLVAKNPCFYCFCRKGRVECDHTACPSLQGCHAILFLRPRGSCCDQCKGCSVNDTTLSHGEISTSVHDPCQIHMCQAGVLTTSRDICKPPCSNPVHVPGQCCPACSGCSFEGNIYKHGQRLFSRHDRDVECLCSGGNISCAKRACPVLNCPHENLYNVKGERCPRCKGQRRVYALRKSCFFARQVYSHGDVTMLDSCTSCVCQKGTMSCERKLCPEVRCPPSDRVFLPGECCPKCRERPVCKSGEKLYTHGEQWKEEQCTDCVCDNGRKWCRARACPNHQGCPLGHKLALIRGECCEKCVRDEKVCTVNGPQFDSFKTFDGLRYNMTGRCKYSLLKECRDNSIGVKIRYKRSNSSTFINDVSITFGENRIKLYSNFKIQVNRTRLVSKNFMKPATFYVRVKPSYVVVHDRKSGVRVVWNMYSSLKVKVDNRFRKSGRLCGLCGNYNGQKRDDLVSQSGKLLSKSEQMSAVWSKKRSCYIEADSGSALTLTNNGNDPVKTSSHIQKAINQLSRVHKNTQNRSRSIDNRSGINNQHRIHKRPKVEKVYSKNNLAEHESTKALQPRQTLEYSRDNRIHSSETIISDSDSTYQIHERPRHHFQDNNNYELSIVNIKHKNPVNGDNSILSGNEQVHKLTAGKRHSQNEEVGILSILPYRVNKNNKVKTGELPNEKKQVHGNYGHISKGGYDTETDDNSKSVETREDGDKKSDESHIVNKDTKTEATGPVTTVRSILISTTNNTNKIGDNSFRSQNNSKTGVNFNLNQDVTTTANKNVSERNVRNGSSSLNRSIPRQRWKKPVNHTEKDGPFFKASSLIRFQNINGSHQSAMKDSQSNEKDTKSTPVSLHSLTTSQITFDITTPNRSKHSSEHRKNNDSSSYCSSQKLSSRTKINQMCTQVRNWVLSTCSGSFHVEDMMRTCSERICNCKGDIQCSKNVVSEYASICVRIPRSAEIDSGGSIIAEENHETSTIPSRPP